MGNAPARFIVEEAENGWVIIVPARDFELYYETQYVCNTLAKIEEVIIKIRKEKGD